MKRPQSDTATSMEGHRSGIKRSAGDLAIEVGGRVGHFDDKEDISRARMRLAVEILSEAKDRDIGLRLGVFVQANRVLNPHEARFAETLVEQAIQPTHAGPATGSSRPWMWFHSIETQPRHTANPAVSTYIEGEETNRCRDDRRYWLAPIVFVLVLFGLLLVFAQSSAVAPFIYTLF